MTSALVITALAVALLVGVISYVRIAWRRAPLVVRAMSLVVLGSGIAGFLLAVPIMHWTGDPLVSSNSRAAVRHPLAAPEDRRILDRPSARATARFSAHVSATDGLSYVLASYVGLALRGSGLMVAGPHGWESWDLIDKGCQMGNYAPSSVLCRAAELAARGWSSATSVPLQEVAQFCAAGYLNNAHALCWWARHERLAPGALLGVAAHASGEEVSGIPEADVAEALPCQGCLLVDVYIHVGYWDDVKSACEREAYPPASPLCEADVIHQSTALSSKHVPYPVVASFCDTGLITLSPEICRAAYRSVGVEGDSK